MSEGVIGREGKFSEAERSVIAEIANATIPKDAARNLPAAGDPSILPAIVRKAEPFEVRVKQGIATLVTEVDPLPASPDKLVALLDRDSRFNRFYQVISIAILQAYYQDARVLEALGLAARPPFPDGHDLEADDWALLEPVKMRAPIFRPT